VELSTFSEDRLDASLDKVPAESGMAEEAEGRRKEFKRLALRPLPIVGDRFKATGGCRPARSDEVLPSSAEEPWSSSLALCFGPRGVLPLDVSGAKVRDAMGKLRK